MTQEEKLLLLKDLCARLPYGVIVKHPYGFGKLESITKEDYGYDLTFETPDDNYYTLDNNIKPYLRPMSSITEEEIKELSEIDMKRVIFSARHLTWHLDGEIIDYLNKKMLDWRGLIPRGLAIEAPEGMYK